MLGTGKRNKRPGSSRRPRGQHVYVEKKKQELKTVDRHWRIIKAPAGQHNLQTWLICKDMDFLVQVYTEGSYLPCQLNNCKQAFSPCPSSTIPALYRINS